MIVRMERKFIIRVNKIFVTFCIGILAAKTLTQVASLLNFEAVFFFIPITMAHWEIVLWTFELVVILKLSSVHKH